MPIYIQSKKLVLNGSKCGKLHIGKQAKHCPELTANDETMRESNKEKYLGDVISKDGRSHATIVERKSKGNGIVSKKY